MDVTGHSRNGTRRNTALGDLITLVVSVCAVRSSGSVAIGNQLAAIDGRIKVQILRIDTEPSFRQKEIAEHNPRTLEAVGNVEYLWNDLEAVSDIQGSRDDSRIIAEGCAEHLP